MLDLQVTECSAQESNNILAEPHVDHFTSSDRERLVELGVELRFMQKDFNELKQLIGENTRVTRAEHGHLSGRVSKLENFRWWLLGAAVGVGPVVTVFARRIFGV